MMKPEDFPVWIPAYLTNQLSADARALFEEELERNSALRAETDALAAMWSGLGLLPEEQPSAAMRPRFYQKLNALARGEQPRRANWWVLKPAQQAAVAAMLFFGGIYVGSLRSGSAASGREIAQLRGQVQTLQQTIALSMLDRPSAAARLEGVAWGTRVQRPDSQVSSALLRALNHDPNVNVRLSSVDALEKFANDPPVRTALVDALPVQDSPLVQIALIDTLVQIRETGVAGELRRLATDPGANVNVRERARWGLQKLGLG